MPSPLQKLIERRKQLKLAEKIDINQFIALQTQEITDQMLAELKPVILAEVKGVVESEIKLLTKETKKGDKGDKGDFVIGAKGDKGEKGSKGDKGDRGVNGVNGTNGINGKDGIDGMDGSPDMPQVIADKLNTLEEKVEIKVIRNLDRILKSLQTSIRESVRTQIAKGGGLSATGTRRITVSDTTPTNPHINDLWVDIS